MANTGLLACEEFLARGFFSGARKRLTMCNKRKLLHCEIGSQCMPFATKHLHRIPPLVLELCQKSCCYFIWSKTTPAARWNELSSSIKRELVVNEKGFPKKL